MKLELHRLVLPLAALVLLAAGCANTTTPEESLRSSLESACANQITCGVTEAACDTTAADLAQQFRAAGATEACVDMALEIYADYFGCVSELTCAQIESESCEDIIRDEAFEGICPGL